MDGVQLKLCLLVGLHGLLLELWLSVHGVLLELWMVCSWSYGWRAAGASWLLVGFCCGSLRNVAVIAAVPTVLGTKTFLPKYHHCRVTVCSITKGLNV